MKFSKSYVLDTGIALAYTVENAPGEGGVAVN